MKKNLEISTADGEHIQTFLAVAQNELTKIIRGESDPAKVERMDDLRSQLRIAENAMHRAFEAL